MKLGLLPGRTTRWGTQAGPGKMGHVVQSAPEVTAKYLLRSPIHPPNSVIPPVHSVQA